ncbi:hypothetical protein SEA_INKED_47 [Arthrobacter phage Inked]|nr:hypothetical protein SEA_INKED_47 [Arthrobacter phage Inked]
MSETITFTCKNCGHTTDVANEFMILEDYSGFECTFQAACDRRQKRDLIIADMKEMAKKPHVHPVDKFTRTSVALCGFFFGCVIAMGLAYLWFGV